MGTRNALKKALKISWCASDQQGKLGVYMKSRMNEEGTLPLTWWDKSLYSASDYGTNLLRTMFGESQKFSFPKSVHATRIVYESQIQMMKL